MDRDADRNANGRFSDTCLTRVGYLRVHGSIIRAATYVGHVKHQNMPQDASKTRISIFGAASSRQTSAALLAARQRYWALLPFFPTTRIANSPRGGTPQLCFHASRAAHGAHAFLSYLDHFDIFLACGIAVISSWTPAGVLRAVFIFTSNAVAPANTGSSDCSKKKTTLAARPSTANPARRRAPAVASCSTTCSVHGGCMRLLRLAARYHRKKTFRQNISKPP